MKKVVYILSVVAVLAMPFLSFAQTGLPTSPIQNVSQATGLITTIVKWMINIFWIITVGFLIWAAFLYLTAGGDEEKLKEAKNRVVYALIAAAVALLSTGLRTIVESFLSGSL